MKDYYLCKFLVNSHLGKIRLFIVIVLHFVCFSVSAQWMQTNGPEGAGLEEIVQSGNVLLVFAFQGGIYRSMDQGVTWSWSNVGLPCNRGILALAEDNGDLYASVNQAGIYKSEDQGASWFPVNSDIENSSFYALYAHEGIVFASGPGVYYSPDKGNTWLDRSNGISGEYIRDFQVQNNRVYAAGSELFESADNGVTWSTIDLPNAPVSGIDALTLKGNTLLAAGIGKVYVSDDNFISFAEVEVTELNASVQNLVVFANTIYLCTSNGRYFVSDDNGLSWLENRNDATDFTVTDLHVTPGRILMSTQQGMYQSPDNGLSWLQSNSGLNGLLIPEMMWAEGFLYAGSSSQGVFRSGDGGVTWEEVNTGLVGLGSKNIHGIVTNGSRIFLATEGGVFTSDDYGDSWTRRYAPGINRYITEITIDNNRVVAAIPEVGVIYSEDGGVNWILLPVSGLSIQMDFTALFFQDDTIVIAGSDGIIYRSTNLGTTWSQVRVGDSYNFVYDLSFDSGELYAATSRGMFVSGDVGNNWSLLGDYQDTFYSIAVQEDLIYAGGPSGVYVAQRTDKVWYSLCVGMGRIDVVSLVTDGTNLYAGTYGQSVWKRGLLAEALPPEEGRDTEVIQVSVCPSEDLIDLYEVANIPRESPGFWSPMLADPNGMFDPGSDPPGLYTFTSIGASCGCAEYQDVNVTLKGINLTGKDTEIALCLSDPPVNLLEFIGVTPDPEGTWNPELNSGTDFFDPATDQEGVYMYSIPVEGCASSSVTFTVKLVKVPDAGGNGIATYSLSDPVFDLFQSLEGTPDTGGIWMPELTSGGSLFDPLTDPPGIYSYVIQNGYCEDIAEVTVTLMEEDILISDYPRFFTPNGDGIHETWGINELVSEDYLLFIYDRYGKLLKQLNPSRPNWDGYYQGAPMPVNDYWFHLKFSDGRELKGHFSLKR